MNEINNSIRAIFTLRMRREKKEETIKKSTTKNDEFIN